MAHPRASFPAAMVEEYKNGAGIKALAAAYRASNHTIRRWLAERCGVRPQGVRP